MSRVETIAAERWRVTVMHGDDVTHESLLYTAASAEYYYAHINISGSTKVLAYRAAGESRFETVRAKFMPTLERTPEEDIRYHRQLKAGVR